jgi:hypothetical protein
MDDELDTFLTTGYCLVDDVYRTEMEPQKPRRRGQHAAMADSEVLTLALLAQWRLDRSERVMLCYARRHWRQYFPRLLTQSAFNRRVRDLAGVLCRLGPALGERAPSLLEAMPPYEVVDGVGVPLLRRCRGLRHRCFGDEAAIGRGGSDRTWAYGIKLLAAVQPQGLCSGFVYGPANTEEHWLADALFFWRRAPMQPLPDAPALQTALGPAHRRHGERQGPTGPLSCPLRVGKPTTGSYLGDLGFRGAAWRQHWAHDYGATVLTKSDYAPRPSAALQRRAKRWLNGHRQIVETAWAWLTARFGLCFPRARTALGLRARIAAKVAAFNVTVLINHLSHRPPFAFPDPYA